MARGSRREDRRTQETAVIYLSNLIKSQPNDRDYIYVPVTSALPDKVDLRPYAGRIEDQGRIGSCTCNATVSACELLLDRAGKPRDLSRLFLYFIIRDYEGRLDQEGAQLRDALYLGRKVGIPPEIVWPYNVDKENDYPCDAAYANVSPINRYERIAFREGDTQYNWMQIQHALAEGMPVVFSMPVTNSLLTLNAPLVQQSYKGVGSFGTTVIGNHAMCIVGYDENLFAPGKSGFIVENSWGDKWGDKGYWAFDFFLAGNQIYEAWVVRGFDGCEVLRFTDEQVKGFLAATALQNYSIQQYVDLAVEYGVSFSQLARCCGVTEAQGRDIIKNCNYPKEW